MKMMDKFLATPYKVWLALIAMTCVSFLIFEGGVLASLSAFAIVAIAALKSRLVIEHFMEVARAPGNFPFLYRTWNFVVAAIIIIGYYATHTP